jgi:hypothetical protein
MSVQNKLVRFENTTWRVALSVNVRALIIVEYFDTAIMYGHKNDY